jgi:hypothetical protein
MASAFLRPAIAGMLVAMGFAVCGCGGTKGQNGAGGEEKRAVYLRGKVTSHGSTPFSLLMLQATDGKVYAIEPGQIADELRSLADMEVSVTATVVPQPEDQYPALEVLSYELLALPSGEIPVVGYIRQGGLIEDSNMTLWMIKGDFDTVLNTFVGSKVWVVGVTQESVLRPDGTTYKVILVTEYGVIRP